MKQKKLIWGIIFLLASIGKMAQAQEALPATGGEAIGNGGTVSYTVGQVVYTAIGSNGSVSQGVQQAYEISPVLGVELTNINLAVSVYPNPTVDKLTLSVKDVDLSVKEALTFQLYNMEGRLLVQKQVVAETTTIEMVGLRTATYFLRVVDNQTTVKTFKIIKN